MRTKALCPFGRYDFSRANDCVPGSNDGADAATGSWYYASQKAVAPIVGGVLDLSRVPGNKPSDTSYRVQVAFEDDHSPAFGITAVYSGAMTLEGVDATPDATTTYCYAAPRDSTPTTAITRGASTSTTPTSRTC